MDKNVGGVKKAKAERRKRMNEKRIQEVGEKKKKMHKEEGKR